MKPRSIPLLLLCLLTLSAASLARPRADTKNSSLGLPSNCQTGLGNASCPIVLPGYQVSYNSTNTVAGFSGTHFTVTFTASTWCEEDPNAYYPAVQRCDSNTPTHQILEVSLSGIDSSISNLNPRSLALYQAYSDAVFVGCSDSGGIPQCTPDPGVSDITAFVRSTQTRIDLDGTTFQGCQQDCFVLASSQQMDLHFPANFFLVATDASGNVFTAGILPQSDYAATTNDETTSAKALLSSSLPATLLQNVTNDTGTLTDPSDSPSCVDPDYAFTNTVWFKFTPKANTLLQIDTSASNYDTFVTVYNGTPGKNTEIGCNQDIDDSHFQSFLTVETDPQSGSAPYYILVGAQGLAWDPNLHFTISAPALLTASTAALSQSAALGSTTSTPFNIAAHNSAVTNIQVGSSDPQFTSSNDCPSSLAAESSCIVTVYFTPAQISTAATLNVTWGSSGHSLQVALTGSSTGPLAGFASSTPSISFPRQFVGTRSAMLPVCSGCSGPFIVGDADGDGRPDVVTSGTQGTASVYFGDGTGGFSRHATITACLSASESSVPFLITDLNHDQKPDLVLLCSGIGGSYASVLLGKGNAAFQSPIQSPGYACEGGWIQSLDMNHDGIPDLVTGCPENYFGQVDTAFGNGDGTFSNISEVFVCADQQLFADLNGDNLPDFVSICSQTGQLDVYLNDGAFQNPTDVSLASGPSSPPFNYQSQAVLADVNNDGKLDIAFTQYGVLDPMELFVGDGQGNFPRSTPSDLYLEGGAILASTSTLPAKSDFIVENTHSGYLTYLQNQGSNAYALSALSEVEAGTPKYASAVDVDGNRNLYSSTATSFSVWPNLQAPFSYAVLDDNKPSSVASFDVEDLDGDGRLDFIGAFIDHGQQDTPEISVVMGGLDGRLLAPQLFAIHDSGTAALQISSIQVSGPFAQTNNCSAQQLSSNKECTVSVSYVPTAIGPQSGALTITDNTFNSPHVIPLSGTGVGIRPSFSLVNFSYQNYAGVPIRLTAKLPADATGEVTFYDGQTAITGAVAVANGVASTVVSGLSVGSHTIAANYDGDTHYASAQTATQNITILSGVQPQRPSRPSRPVPGSGTTTSTKPVASHIAAHPQFVRSPELPRAGRAENEIPSPTRSNSPQAVSIPMVPAEETLVLPDACVGRAFSYAIANAISKTSTSWALNPIRWDDALVLDPDTGLIHGSPSKAGVLSATIKLNENPGAALAVKLTVRSCESRGEIPK